MRRLASPILLLIFVLALVGSSTVAPAPSASAIPPRLAMEGIKGVVGAIHTAISGRGQGIRNVNRTAQARVNEVEDSVAATRWQSQNGYLTPAEQEYLEGKIAASLESVEELARAERNVVRRDTAFFPNLFRNLRRGVINNLPQILVQAGVPDLQANIIGQVARGENPLTAALDATITKIKGDPLVVAQPDTYEALRNQLRATETALSAIKGTDKRELAAEVAGLKATLDRIQGEDLETAARELGTLRRGLEELENTVARTTDFINDWFPDYPGPSLQRLQQSGRWREAFAEFVAATFDPSEEMRTAIQAGIAREGEKLIDEMEALGLGIEDMSLSDRIRIQQAISDARGRAMQDGSEPDIAAAVLAELEEIGLERSVVNAPDDDGDAGPGGGPTSPGDDDPDVPAAGDEDDDEAEPEPDSSWIPAVVAGWVSELVGQGVSQSVAVGLVAPAEACLHSQAASGATQQVAAAACKGQILAPPAPDEPDDPEPDLSWIPGVVAGWVSELVGEGIEQGVAQQLVAPAQACLQTEATNGATQQQATATCEGEILEPPEPEGPDLSWIPAVVEGWIQSLITNDGVTRQKAEELVAPAAACLENEATAGATQQQAVAGCQDQILPPPPPPPTNFAGAAAGAACPTGPPRYQVALSQTGDAVSGSISLHNCPGEGRATYLVSGTATSADTVALTGTLQSGQGPYTNWATPGAVFTYSKSGALTIPLSGF